MIQLPKFVTIDVTNFGTITLACRPRPAVPPPFMVRIPDNVKRGLEIIALATIDEVLGHALTAQPEPIEWPEGETVEQLTAKPTEVEDGDVLTH